ncbi:MAG: penicillin-binding protein activator LpoB [Treponema sp.]|jgi:TolB-like protein|nr:penicillin-binding protein activator LpoB [Treponema sp.]
MKMKKFQFIWFGIILFIFAGGGDLFAQARRNQQPATPVTPPPPSVFTIDTAIEAGAGRITERLNPSNADPISIKVVVLNFKSDSSKLSSYVLDEMMMYLVNSDRVTVVDRANLELIQQEMQFQLSGEVSDSSAQAIGQKLGAQSIVSGSIDDMGDVYRIRFKTINVETAVIQVQSAHDVRKDQQIGSLMGTQQAARPAAQAPSASATTNTARPAASPPPAQARPVTPAKPTSAYSGGRKFFSGVLNIGFGLGSLTMGDFFGFIMVGGLDALGWVGYFTGLSMAAAAQEMYSTIGVGYTYDDYKSEILSAQIFAYGGLAIVGIGAIYGFVRPGLYDKEVSIRRGYRSENNPMNNITLSPVFFKNGASGMSLLYNKSF